MGVTIGLVAIKGGVGKTTLSASLASDLVNHYGQKVLLVDGNYSAPNLGVHMDILKPEKTIHDVLAGRARISSAIHNRYGVDVIPGSIIYDKEINTLKLKDKLKAVKDDYDFIIIDSSPNLNEEVLSTMLASDHIFVVSTPDHPTLFCSMKAARLAKQRGKPITGIILNKIRDPGYEVSLAEIEEQLGIPVVAKISDDSINVRALFTRIPTTLYHPKSKFSKEVRRLGAALTGNPEKSSWVRLLLPFHLGKQEVNRELLKQSLYSRTFAD